MLSNCRNSNSGRSNSINSSNSNKLCVLCCRYSAAACVDVIEELPLLRVSLEAAAPLSSSFAAMLQSCTPAAGVQQHRHVLVHAPAGDEAPVVDRRDTVWSDIRSDSGFAVAGNSSRVAAPVSTGAPGAPKWQPRAIDEGSANGETSETGGAETDGDSESDEGNLETPDEALLAAFSFDSKGMQQQGSEAVSIVVAAASKATFCVCGYTCTSLPPGFVFAHVPFFP